MHSMVTQVTSNADIARQAGESISAIREGSNQVVDVASDISTALKEQSAASDMIAKEIEVIATMSEENTNAMVEARKASENMKRLSNDMHDMVARFGV